ncbi:MAG: hypothetical protein GY816_16800 [Cytophagales bacterium]|nr:hypothetical protein [Cytophagales bacterium]
MGATIEKLDLHKTDKNYYKIGKEPEIRDLDAYYYLTREGSGGPENTDFMLTIEQLYAVAYKIKFLCKAEDMDFVVPKMEAFWWIKGGLEKQHLFPQTPKEEWNWKIVIRMPDFVEADHFSRAVQTVKVKSPNLLKNDEVQYELINEGKCAQILHLGSYGEEEPTLMKIMKHIEENGLKVNNYHHEIYLSNPRKTPEQKLRTILRYGVE